MSATTDHALSSRRLSPVARFVVYGLLGLCVETLFTSLMDYANGTGDLRLRGYSYVWMLPIWGAGVMLCESLGLLLRRQGLGLAGRAGVYVALCFGVEYLTGALLVAVIGRCPWDYSASEWSVHGLIRLDYAPFWALSGIVGEKVCSWVRRVRISVKDPALLSPPTPPSAPAPLPVTSQSLAQ